MLFVSSPLLNERCNKFSTSSDCCEVAVHGEWVGGGGGGGGVIALSVHIDPCNDFNGSL